MDPIRFDRISRAFAQRRISRRTALAAGGGGIGAAAFGAFGLRAGSAQEASPAATPVATPQVVDAGGAKDDTDPTFMFVQSFESGTVTPVPGSDDSFTLELQHGGGQTVYFSDRPDRIVGATSTEQFLGSLPFGADNPPNAALVLETSQGETDVVVVELTDPSYDAGSSTLTYHATSLADYSDFDAETQQEPSDFASLDGSFNGASLFIDDCPNTSLWCFTPDGFLVCDAVGIVSNVGTCWSWDDLACNLCRSGADTCAANYSQCANDGCEALTPQQVNQAGC